MYTALICLALSTAGTAPVDPEGPGREVFVTPWLAYGTAAGPAEPDLDIGGAPDLRRTHREHMSGGVEVLVPIGHQWGLLGAVDRSVARQYRTRREASVTAASVGFLALTDRTGTVCWDLGFSLGLMWPDPWGPRRANVLARWRLASALQVHRFAAFELAAGFQMDSGEFRRLRGPFGRVGVRLGPRGG